MNVVERILTAIAVLLMPFIGLAAAAHQMEQRSSFTAAVYGIGSIVALVQLARHFWHLHKGIRLHRAL